MNYFKIFLTLILAVGISFGINAASYKGETAVAGGPPGTIFIAFAAQASKGGVDIEVNAGKTLTKSMLSAGKGDIAFYSGVPNLYVLMKNKKAMYSKIEEAPEYADNLRSILGFKAGVFHVLTKENSGINEWKDIKGKKIFLGPPAGAAKLGALGIMKGVTGYDNDKDYEGVILPWGEGINAFRDNKVDVMVRPCDVGCALVQQFGLNSNFRLLSIPESALDAPALKKQSSSPGRGITLFDGAVYKGQLTQGTIRALGFNQFIGTTKMVDEDVVYNVTKSFWDNLDDIHKTAVFLKEVTKATAFTSVNLPLHKGAYRYYKEHGFDVPENLIPKD
jgi:TRAP transporter TAXI family solute receptor